MPRETAAQQQERLEAKARLLRYLKPGDRVYTLTVSASRSGMQRSIMVLIGVTNERTGRPEVEDISSDVARALGEKWDNERGGVKVRGTGMDMHFALIYDLSHTLFGSGSQLSKVSL